MEQMKGSYYECKYSDFDRMNRIPHHKNRIIPDEDVPFLAALFESPDDESYKFYTEMCNTYPKNGENHKSEFSTAIGNLYKTVNMVQPYNLDHFYLNYD